LTGGAEATGAQVQAAIAVDAAGRALALALGAVLGAIASETDAAAPAASSASGATGADGTAADARLAANGAAALARVGAVGAPPLAASLNATVRPIAGEASGAGRVADAGALEATLTLIAGGGASGVDVGTSVAPGTAIARVTEEVAPAKLARRAERVAGAGIGRGVVGEREVAATHEKGGRQGQRVRTPAHHVSTAPAIATAPTITIVRATVPPVLALFCAETADA